MHRANVHSGCKYLDNVYMMCRVKGKVEISAVQQMTYCQSV